MVELQYALAAKWWVDRLQYDPNYPDVARGDLANQEKMKQLTDALAEGIKADVEKWQEVIQPYSIDTTFNPEEEVLENALKAADVRGVCFPVNVVMEITKGSVVVNVREVIFGERV